MVSKLERFWILFILRFAIGLFFLFVALQQFSAGPNEFAEGLSKGFSGTWLASVELPAMGGKAPYTGMDFIKGFLFCLPYAFAALSVLILTGLLLKTALRLSALLLIALGLGKYMQSPDNIGYLANDFFIAFLICVALYFMALQKPAVAVVTTPQPVR